MQCYDHGNVYPYKIFPPKGLTHIRFAPITIFYGSNGSGKSTLLNVIAEKLGIERTSPFNYTPYFESYLKFCHYSLPENVSAVPYGSKTVTSDDVFDYLLSARAVNRGISDRRAALSEEHRRLYKEDMPRLSSLSEIDDYLKMYEVKNTSRSQYIARRGRSNELAAKSNGESAFSYFTDKITENALYLLDEPENSLAPKLQYELLHFIEESVRFYGCQFIIATHSPFLLSLPNAKIYDLDSTPVETKKWTELSGVRAYYDFFKKYEKEFDT
ncbi:MAG: AAA family ATPase [Ruminococcaceae bacterium]|nr:AAA family ATPase [Oscillospiraceae bacterium]